MSPLKFTRPFGTHLPYLPTVSLLVMLGFGLLPSGWAQNPYGGDGTPTALEEEIRWRVNRGRFDSAAENLNRGTSYTDIPATAGPLAPNESLALAARHHSEDMARNNVFQHDTIPGSAYYDPVTQPSPWDRFEAEGYVWNGAGENIAAGYNGAEQAYVGWWKSTGHRRNMYNSGLRDIGNGYYYWNSSSYRRYYTMDLGRVSGGVFFTGTIYHDSNGTGVYDAGEGVEGVAVLLRVGGSLHGEFDISSEAGSFAVPCATIPAGTTVAVVLSNTASASVTLSLPVDYSLQEQLVLAGHETRVWGEFVKPSGSVNSGFRNVSVLPAAPSVPRLQVAGVGNGVQLHWASQTGFQYQLQASVEGQTWADLTPSPLSGSGGTMSHTDTDTGAGYKLYRLEITAP